MGIGDLVGLTLTRIERSDPENANERLVFHSSDGRRFLMWHQQDCCESVHIEDIVGDLNDLIGCPITTTEERRSNNAEIPPLDQYEDSYTWTFYELATVKGSVTIRWYGTSNGYYSEGVDFEEAGEEFGLPDWILRV